MKVSIHHDKYFWLNPYWLDHGLFWIFVGFFYLVLASTSLTFVKKKKTKKKHTLTFMLKSKLTFSISDLLQVNLPFHHQLSMISYVTHMDQKGSKSGFMYFTWQWLSSVSVILEKIKSLLQTLRIYMALRYVILLCLKWLLLKEHHNVTWACYEYIQWLIHHEFKCSI